LKLLLDTHVFLWVIAESRRLSPAAKSFIGDPNHELVFSAVSLWEIAIKTGRARHDFRVDPSLVRRSLLENGYAELPVTGAHATAVAILPPIHKDPFDRMLVAQATVEGLTLVTSDPTVADYPGPIRRI
jgi:PIN domain nuclease of toxin-antitoxin system